MALRDKSFLYQPDWSSTLEEEFDMIGKSFKSSADNNLNNSRKPPRQQSPLHNNYRSFPSPQITNTQQNSIRNNNVEIEPYPDNKLNSPSWAPNQLSPQNSPELDTEKIENPKEYKTLQQFVGFGRPAFQLSSDSKFPSYKNEVRLPPLENTNFTQRFQSRYNNSSASIRQFNISKPQYSTFSKTFESTLKFNESPLYLNSSTNGGNAPSSLISNQSRQIISSSPHKTFSVTGHPTPLNRNIISKFLPMHEHFDEIQSPKLDPVEKFSQRLNNIETLSKYSGYLSLSHNSSNYLYKNKDHIPKIENPHSTNPKETPCNQIRFKENFIKDLNFLREKAEELQRQLTEAHNEIYRKNIRIAQLERQLDSLSSSKVMSKFNVTSPLQTVSKTNEAQINKNTFKPRITNSVSNFTSPLAYHQTNSKSTSKLQDENGSLKSLSKLKSLISNAKNRDKNLEAFLNRELEDKTPETLSKPKIDPFEPTFVSSFPPNASSTPYSYGPTPEFSSFETNDSNPSLHTFSIPPNKTETIAIKQSDSCLSNPQDSFHNSDSNLNNTLENEKWLTKYDNLNNSNNLKPSFDSIFNESATFEFNPFSAPEQTDVPFQECIPEDSTQSLSKSTLSFLKSSNQFDWGIPQNKKSPDDSDLSGPTTTNETTTNLTTATNQEPITTHTFYNQNNTESNNISENRNDPSDSNALEKYVTTTNLIENVTECESQEINFSKNFDSDQIHDIDFPINKAMLECEQDKEENLYHDQPNFENMNNEELSTQQDESFNQKNNLKTEDNNLDIKFFQVSEVTSPS